MIIATISTKNNNNLAVEVVDVFEDDHRGKLARVRSLEGEVFPVWLGMGWGYSEYTTVRVYSLRNVALSAELPVVVKVSEEV